ncbi:MAG: DUF3343 domain-containing protein [Clostridiales bacterium]|nr:DUF3343 domain-containing protein [Clostridiales bacterium]
MPDCILTMKTRTQAESARRIAGEMRIPASVVSVDPSVTRYGCAFGLRFPCAASDRLTSVLRRKNLSFGEVIGANR